jgi:hypothetical protein
MRLALIGNGQISRDYSEFIDKCDLVIRCNEAKNLGKNSGNKTDVLCITNTGAPARRLINLRSVQQYPKFPDIQEIWFPRDSDVHLEWIERFNISFPRSELIDIGNKIIQANNLENLSVKRFSNNLNKISFQSLKKVSNQFFVCPSTGFLAFIYISQNIEFKNFEKYLFGFTFEMWHGHPADSERFIFNEEIKSRSDIKLIN